MWLFTSFLQLRDILFNFNICSYHVCLNGQSKRRYRAKLFLIVADGMMRESDIKLQHGQFKLDTMEKSLRWEGDAVLGTGCPESYESPSSDVFKLQLGEARADLM